ncbi:N-ethylammeline chlorohydrolase [Candidatus Magnetomorum sp. HK-1]|nr:N-ethylammeline chlorohydrolase [Candidatus Magnetomorum sp. HK-1]
MSISLDTIIYNAKIITVDSEFSIIDKGWIGIHDGKIKHLSKMPQDNELPDAQKQINASGCIVMPGLVNTHTHLPMTLFRGLADDLPLEEWLNDHIFPAESKNLTPESVRWGTRLACAEMILSGTTTCCDSYLYENYTAEAVSESGMRAVLAQGIVDFPVPGVPDPTENIKNAMEFVEKWKNKCQQISPSVFCHAPYTCGPETLKKAKSEARSQNILFQTHVAETRLEREDSLKKHGLTPIQYLDQLGILDDMTLLVHAVWIDENDQEIIKQSQAKISHNPGSNLKLGSGIAPVPDCLNKNILVGLGTDGCASNNNLDLFQEINLAAKIHKGYRVDPTIMDVITLIRMATIDGAKILGLDHRIGSLEIGKQADIIVINAKAPHLLPMYHPESHIVYSVSGSDVIYSFVDGRCLLDQRNLTTFNLDLLVSVFSGKMDF